MNNAPIDPPKGCQEIPGYIIEVARGGPWLSMDGTWTPEWSERGVWDTQAEAESAVQAWCELMDRKPEAF